MKKKRTFQPILVFIAIGFLLYGSYALCTSVSQKKYKRAEISENDKEINVRENIKLDNWFIKWMDIYKYQTIRENTKLYY